MKNSIIILSSVIVFSACGEKSIDDLLQEKKDMQAKHKESVRNYEMQMRVLDSTIAAHPDFSTEKPNIKTVPVTVDTVKAITFEHYFEVHGNVQAEENAALYAEAPGTVKKIHVVEGQTVRKGDLIISLDAGAVESGYKEVQTALELAQKVYQKQSALWEQKIGSEMQYLQAKNNKESLEQKMKTMKEQLDMYTVRAPFDGVVDIITPKVGEAAAPGFPIARIMNLEKVYLEADVSEKYLSSVKTGSYVEIKFPELGETVVAKVARAGNFINPANRTFKVKIEFLNPGGKYKPNQLAVLKIRDYTAENALVIPSKVVQEDRNGNEYVYTFTSEKDALRVKKLMIKTGISYDGISQVLEGLQPNQVILNKGSKSVQEGDAIEIK